ncbi:hypothetical protein cypCar_00005321 [Cyprinus carpio]|nr:hypothetical protein cypCar_00005321 [Cyprinus carpio]
MDDEEVAESWEEAADSGEMERRLEEKLRISQKERSPRGSSHTLSEENRSGNHVVRQPAGPDGTQGFHHQRR